MVLIIAEKPSLGRNIAAAIGNMSRRDGYLEGGGYIISWAFGHLFSLADIEAYGGRENENSRWTMDNLPCFPESFKFELRRDGSKKLLTAGCRSSFLYLRLFATEPTLTR